MKAKITRRHFLKTSAMSPAAIAAVNLLRPASAAAANTIQRTGKPRFPISIAAYSFRDYFNSIPVEGLVESLPPTIVDDEPLHRLLVATLRDKRVLVGDREVLDSHKGVMAGTPLAPLLSNLYLRPLDDAFEEARIPFVRYADDMVVFGTEQEVVRHGADLERRLGGLGLSLNERKTRLSPPGRPWEFLGLRYDRGSLDLAANTAAKLRRRVRRIARRARRRPDPRRRTAPSAALAAGAA